MGSYGPRHVLRMHRLPLLNTHVRFTPLLSCRCSNSISLHRLAMDRHPWPSHYLGTLFRIGGLVARLRLCCLNQNRKILHCKVATLRHQKKKVHTLARSILKTEPWSLYTNRKPGTGVVAEVRRVASLHTQVNSSSHLVLARFVKF